MNRLLACAVLFAGCQYDYDKLYEHAADGDSDAGTQLTSTKLISKWIGHMPLTQECIDCAEAECEEENAACMGDPQCLGYTECVGKTPTPTGQAACRAQYATWVNESASVRQRDLNGPYGQCVFRFRCTSQCTADSELWCLGDYTLPTTSESTVPLSLYLIDASVMTPVTNATVRACSVQNPRECSETTADAMGVTNAAGMVKLKLPTSFNRAFTGYLEITASGLYPTLLKFSTNLAEPSTQVVSMVAEGQFKLGLNSAGVTPDDSRGMLQLRMLGCQGAGVKGAFFSLQDAVEGSRTWYIVNGFPRFGDTGTAPVGSGGIIDVPAGTVRVNAKNSEGVLLGAADAPIRAKFMTVVIYQPLDKN